jgi:RHS repeat-associated protein
VIGVASAGLASVALAIALALSFAGGGQDSSVGVDAVASSWSLAHDLFAVPGVQDLDGAQQLRDQALASRLSPSAVFARERSRTAFAHLDAATAARVAREELPSVLAAAPTGLATTAPGGGRIERYLSSDSARISLPGGKHAMVVTMGPIATRDGSGAYGPLDLGLREDGGGFTPANPAVAVRIPKTLAAGVDLAASGVSLTPVDGSGTPLRGSGGLDQSAVLYANTQLDTDTVVKATPSGFETDTLLRSVNSPEQLSFQVGLPAGAHLEPVGGGSGATRVVSGGETIAVIPTATAQDAEGATVPVATSVSGSTLRLDVAHHGRDYRYPITVDPAVDSKFSGSEGNWRWENSGTRLTGDWYESSLLVLSAGSFYHAEEWVAAEYPTQGESHIYILTMETAANVPTGIENHLGIMGAPAHEKEKGTWEANEALGSSYGRTLNVVCVVTATCSSSAGSAANVATYWMNAALETGGSGEDVLYAGSVYIAQNNGPAASYDTTTEAFGGTKNALYGSGSWITGAGKSEAKLNMTDPGVGDREASYTATGGVKWTTKVVCAGPVQCPESTSQYIRYKNGATTLPEGEPTVEAQVFNGMGSSVTTSAKVKVDNAAPSEIALSGLPESGEISDAYRALKLTAKAKDGSSVLSSGVASLKLAVDGQEVGAANGSCSPGPCTATGEWTINAEEFGAGKHAFTVTATDVAGNVTTSSETPFTVHHATPRSFGPGTVNPVTGDFDLEESDVSITTSGPSLSVVRNYDSREPAGGAEGPLGAPWSLSIGGAQELVRNPSNKNMVLTSASGGRSTFVYKSAGHYDSPTGDKNLVLTANSGETEYTLTDSGATTTFKHTSGESENVFRPAIATGTGGTSTTQYTYQVVGGVLRPTQELAPVPAGVTCTELKRGCRALLFSYATSTTATGEGSSEWGNYNGRLTQVSFKAYEPVSKEMSTKAVAQYSYDSKGRLRAEWDPRVSPALKTTYGYDAEGHVTAMSPAGQEPWIFGYGTASLDASAGRLVTAGHPVASTALGSGVAPANTAAPVISVLHPLVGKAASVSAGSWSNSPLRYGYQWERCNSSGGSCVPIAGAINREYTPQEADVGGTLVARVSATNAFGTVSVPSAASAVVSVLGSAAPQPVSEFGSLGSGSGQLKSPAGIALDSKWNAWVADAGNNRIEEFNSSGSFVRTAGTSGSGLLSKPEAVAVDSANNVWVTDTGNNRVVEFNSSGEYLKAFGSLGSGNGQFKTPWGIAIDGSGHVWVSDSGNVRLQEFTSAGAWIRNVGKQGTEEGNLSWPGQLAIDSSNNVWVSDPGNNRVTEYSNEGVYIRQFGTEGTGNGQFTHPGPWGIGIDGAGHVWASDSNHNRVEVFSSTGGFIQTFGSTGSGSGQFNSPDAIAFSSNGYVFVVDQSNNRVTKWTDGAPTPVSEFGTVGSGNGQLKKPWGLARDSGGNLWVADSGNNRIEEFNSSGSFVRTAGTSGSGLLSKPEAVAVDSSNNVWVADTGNNRVVEFKASGEYVKAFGSLGSGNGQFKTPWGIAIDGSGHVWVSDSSNVRLQEFTSEGTWVRNVGKQGTEEGNLSWPGQLAIDSSNNVWVADPGNNRITEYSNEGVYIRQFGTAGTGNGQFTHPGPWGIGIDGAGHVWVSDTNHSRVEVFSATGEFIGQFGQSGTAAGQFSEPGMLTVTAAGEVFVADMENNRIAKWSGGSYWEGVSTSGTETALPASATSTIEYGVPVSGAGAPYAMSSTDVAKWAQTDVPAEATAVFPPDEPQGWPASDYKRAAIGYLDSADRLVNVAEPGGAISTTEYNSYNDVTRTLSADNREAALKEGAKSAETAQTLDTQKTYGSEGTELSSTLGPLHTVKLASGASVSAREHAVYSYDENAPSGGPYRLETKVTTGAQISGEPEADVRTTTKSYAGQNNLGWVLRQPTATRTDPSGLKLTRTTVYDPASGNVTETRTPAAGAPGEEILSGYIYRNTFASLGSGNGQVSKPATDAVDKEGNVWVADTENNRVEEFSSGGTFVQKFGTEGTGNGQFKKPAGIALDGEGNVWVVDTGNNRVEKFSNTGTYLSKFGTEGAGYLEGAYFKSPKAIAYSPTQSLLYVADAENNVVRAFNLSGVFQFKIGSSLGSAGSENGQFNKAEGVAVDASGNVWVADTGNSRVQEFSVWGSYLKKFGSAGVGEEYLHLPKGIAVDSEGNVFVADDNEHSRILAYTSAGVREFQFGSQGTGTQNMKNPAGLALDSVNDAYVVDTGNNRIQKWSPAALVHESTGTGGTHGKQTIYYTAGENTQVAACGEHAEWAGLPCEVRPAAQPETSGVPNLPVTTVTYNMWDGPLVSTETVGATTRTTTNTYDGAERLLTTAVSSAVGTTLPTVKLEYSSETGALIKQSTTVESTTRTIESVFNKLGQRTSYKDADGNTSTFTYDIDGRLESENDGKGTQTLTYDTTTGYLTKLVDSAAGTFTGAYDVEGKLVTAGYPNGMNVNHTYNALGREVGVEYVKTTHCTSGCTWYSETEAPSIHGQALSQSSTLSSESYTYDAAGRLTKAQDTPASEGCTTRIYAYDEETNIQSLTTRAPGGEGKCATEGGTAANHSYDAANRLTDTGIAYDTFGDITKLPAGDAGGSELTSTYYVDETLATQSQAGETIGYYLDPQGRTRQTVATGTTNTTITSHYADASRMPAWTEDTVGHWTRNISGLGGGLAAIQTNGEAPVLQIEDLQGSIVGTALLSETATGLLTKGYSTEYGVPRTSSPAKYSWLGGFELPTEFPSGVLAMGARSYVPEIGRFLQPDPVEGGSANAYAYTYGDPVNTSDPSGEFTVATPAWVGEFLSEEATVATEAAIERAAEEQAAREEAELAAQEAEEAWAEAYLANEAAAAGGGGHHGGHHGGGARTSSTCAEHKMWCEKGKNKKLEKHHCGAACKEAWQDEVEAEERRRKRKEKREKEEQEAEETEKHFKECPSEFTSYSGKGGIKDALDFPNTEGRQIPVCTPKVGDPTGPGEPDPGVVE